MILVAVAACALVVLALIAGVLVAMPSIPTSYWSTLSTAVTYIASGIKFLNYFTNTAVVIPLALCCILLHNVYVAYKVVLWVVKKIPFFGVSD